MSGNSLTQEAKNILLVEGDNDLHVIMALCMAYSVPEIFKVLACGSDNQVLETLNSLITSSEPPEVIGVVLDADKFDGKKRPSFESRWGEIQQTLQGYSYTLPARPDSQGTLVKSAVWDTKLGFWLMPNNEKSGMLEDFCAELAEPKSFQFAKECVEEAQARELTSFKAVHYSKAIIHTYLAWHDEPGTPLGRAITKKALLPQTAIAQRFTDWLIRLFT